MKVAAEMELSARRTSGTDNPQHRRLFSILEEATEQAVRGTLTETTTRGFLGRIHEAATGEKLETYSVEEWFTSWLSDKKRARSEGTGIRYDGIVRSFLGSLSLAKRTAPLGALTVADIRRFRDRLLDEGRSAATANMSIKVLRSPLNAAKRQGLLVHSPADAVELLASADTEKDVFSANQVKALIGAAEGDDWKGLILAGYYTGVRLGDLSNLQWSNIDEGAQIIEFRQAKTKKALTIPIHPELRDWLRSIHDRTEFVFPSLAGQTSSGRSGLSGQFSRIMAKAQIQGTVSSRSGDKGRNRSSLSFHSLRHSFNSAMANAGISQEMRQRLTGHASKAINDRYTHAELDTLRSAVEAVPALSE